MKHTLRHTHNKNQNSSFLKAQFDLFCFITTKQPALQQLVVAFTVASRELGTLQFTWSWEGFQGLLQSSCLPRI